MPKPPLPPEPTGVGGYTKEPDKMKKHVLTGVLEEFDIMSTQRNARKKALEEMESHSPGKTSAYVAFVSSETMGASIDSDDIPALGDILMSVGEVEELNLIINSPGGDGTIAEKIIEMCRSYCDTFRVIVPNRAKSAATIIALGADKIVMGYCSELGPIDAQVPVLAGNILQYISAQSFVDARESLEDRYAEAVKAKKDIKPILQQIATLDAPFIDHCEKLMDFSREVARKYLAKYMFASITPAAKQAAAIDNVLDRLSAVNIFKVHGRMIDGHAAKTELGLDPLLLGKEDALWQALWHYYVRTDVALGRGSATKILESKSNFLVKATTLAQ